MTTLLVTRTRRLLNIGMARSGNNDDTKFVYDRVWNGDFTTVTPLEGPDVVMIQISHLV